MERLDELFRSAAQARPQAIAIRDPARGAEISYADLDTSVGRLVTTLSGAGVGSGDRVGLCVPKSIASVTGLLAILRAGAAYVPVDVTAPPARNGFIFRDCSVHSVLADPQAAETLTALPDAGFAAAGSVLAPDKGVELVRVGLESRGAEPTDGSPDDLAYVLYTSGSTGRPKGVMHTHASARAFVDWCKDTFGVRPDDRFTSHAPFHFDLSIHDLYVPLTSGATLVLIGESDSKQPLALARLVAEERITVWYSTPSILRLMAEFAKMAPGDYENLRIAHFAGEVFPIKHLRAIKAIWQKPRFFNLYGPTETNVCTYFEIPARVEEDRTRPFPIGRPSSGDLCRVVDEEDRDVAEGEEGELLVAGPSVMSGYWNLPERNARAFVLDADGVKWYRTGDVVKDMGGQCFDFLGRRDRMVKRRGYRVELGEIEAALHRHPDVSEAAVVAIPDEDAGVNIRAFVAWKGEGRPSLIKMKQYCAKELPLYMIPDVFSFPPSLPKTSTDKIDYQKLKGSVS
jgi:amino acid adenylation domain-containing protein